MKKLLLFAFVLLLALFAGFLFRNDILKGIGNFLIREDSLQKADAIFVLGGDSYDRGNRAIELYTSGFSDKIVCLGKNIPTIFKAVGLSYAESELTKMHLISPLSCLNITVEDSIPPQPKTALPDSAVIVLKVGTSTKEEASAIINYCKENKLSKVIVISSRFHTRRVRWTCADDFRKENITLMVTGAKSSIYEEEEWWESEEGLLMVNNEYVKLIYYLLKY